MGPFAPQLLFPTFAATRRDAVATSHEWADLKTLEGLDEGGLATWVDAQVRPILAADGSTLVIGKSLGSYAAAAAADLTVPAIWVTPLLTSSVVTDALSRSGAPFLLVGGTADPFWDGNLARHLTPHVLELTGADHGLFLPGPLKYSAENIGHLASASERFIDEVVWPV